jgi:ribulose-phosphate 3-epimerase
MSRLASFRRLCGNVPLIAASMLKCDFGNLQRDVALLESAKADVLHLDVMDGHFVPNLSYGPVVIERLRGLTELPFDTHLMISDPARYLDDFLAAGCDWMTFHVEAVPEPVPLLRRIRERGAVAGLAVNPGTPVTTVLPILDECDVVLVMSVQPGFGGQSFMPQVLDKVKQIADHRKDGPLISIDGGIGPKTIAAAANAGAENFVIGSAIFESTDFTAAISELRQLAVARRTDAILGV